MKLEIEGIADMQSLVGDIAKSAESICSSGLYKGAGIAAERLKAACGTIPNEMIFHPDNRGRLAEHVGIAAFWRDGSVHTVVGFNGYLPHATELFPQGLPAVVLARSIESGSSKLPKKYPFVRKTLNAAKAEIESAMESGISEAINKINVK